MITPVEIQNKEFSKSAFGYNKNEVDEFLGIIESEYDALYKENIALNDKINMLRDAIKEYKSMEAALQSTIMTAQNVATELETTAKLKAETIIKEAENKAADIIINAKKEVSDIINRKEVLAQEYDIYKIKIKNTVEEQLKIINEI
ncbi:MAG: DivIVA domain-containing protein [Clostridia bacterium]|nr:DivIVA domain-containing protein [Oscillospiraceae bacterium]MBR4892565.1 DivIVA domain-containing protein [Clostridia bacterium]